MRSSLYLVGNIPLLVSFLEFLFCSNPALTLVTERLICGMTDLEEGDYFIHPHPVIIFLLLNNLVSMVSRKGSKENQVMFFFTNCQFIISLEVIIHLEANLKASLESLQGHIVRLPQRPS